MAYIDKYGVEFSDDRKTLVRCPKDFKGEYVIPEGVNCIKMYAFDGCIDLTSVTIPDSVTSIECDAFDGCSGITKMVVAEGNTKYDSRDNCNAIIETSSNELIHGCKNTIIPNSITSIRGCAFYDCTGLKSIIIPDKVTSIETFTFYGCSGLKSISIPNSVTNIGSWAFDGCRSLTSIEIPNNVTSIESDAFDDCSSLTSIVVEAGNSIYDSRNNCNAIIETATNTLIIGCKNTIIPNSVTSIGGAAFSNCSGLKSITIPDSVISIRKEAFAGCADLEAINIPNSVTNIGPKAFAGCLKLEQLSLPSNLHRIPLCIFNGHNKIEDIEKILSKPLCFCNGTCNNPLIVSKITRYNSSTYLGNCLLEVDKNIRGEFIVPEHITSINNSAFCECESMTSILLPKGIKRIGNEAFVGCTGLTTIKFPNDFVEIGRSAFRGCVNLKEAYVPFGSKGRYLQMKELCFFKIIECENEKSTILLNLAKAYEFGVGVQKCLSQAMTFYTQAAEEGSSEAAYHLGELYEQIEVEPTDLIKAYKYYQQAANYGFSDAQDRVNKLKKRVNNLESGQEQPKKMYLFFDTETTGLPNDYKASVKDSRNWPRLVQIAWLLVENDGNVVKKKSAIIYPNGFTIPQHATNVHHISTEQAKRDGLPLRDVLEEFMQDFEKVECLVAHNMEFDQHVIGAELYRIGKEYDDFMGKQAICTMKSSTNYCALPKLNEDYGYKWPKLEELYYKLFGKKFNDAHDALADITATKECFFELKKRGIIK